MTFYFIKYSVTSQGQIVFSANDVSEEHPLAWLRKKIQHGADMRYAHYCDLKYVIDFWEEFLAEDKEMYEYFKQYCSLSPQFDPSEFFKT